MIYRNLIITGITLCTLYACSRSGTDKPTRAHSAKDQTATTPKSDSPSQSDPPSKTPTQAQSSQSERSDRIQGRVVETMNAGGYTYVSIKTASGKIVWAAGRPAVIKVGDQLDIKRDMEMTNFTSKTLGRTFDSIYFVSSLKGDTASQIAYNDKSKQSGIVTKPKSRFPSLTKPSAKSRFPSLSSGVHDQGSNPRVNMNPSHAFGSGSASASASASNHVVPSTPQSKDISVVKAEGGYTIAEIFAQSRALAGQEIMVRGTVVKFNSGIMGKNWIHLQDGTGNAMAKTHDLTVTSDETTSVGQTILVKGTLAIDLDVGAGYKYPVIIERATLVK